MTTYSSLTEAIDRSRSHNEIVTVEIAAADISAVVADLHSLTDGDLDYAQENDGSYDVWGWTDEMDEGRGEMDWRLNVRLIAPEYTTRSTASGYAVVRADGSYAEFMGSDEADEAARLLNAGEATERNYDWGGGHSSALYESHDCGLSAPAAIPRGEKVQEI